MYLGQLSAMAAYVEKELEYYKKVAQEQKEIIEQLTGTGKPKGYVYMHPFDFADLIRKADSFEYVDVIRSRDSKLISSEEFLNVNGRRIKQSPHIPAVSTNFV